MMHSVSLIPRRAWIWLTVAILLTGSMGSWGCIAVIKKVQHPATKAVVEDASFSAHWIWVDLKITRPRDCPSQATQFLRRRNPVTGNIDLMPISVTNTTISDASTKDQQVTLWFPKPLELEETGPGWGYWNKAQDDCGVLAWLLGPPTRESETDTGQDTPLKPATSLRGDMKQ